MNTLNFFLSSMESGNKRLICYLIHLQENASSTELLDVKQRKGGCMRSTKTMTLLLMKQRNSISPDACSVVLIDGAKGSTTAPHMVLKES